MQRRLAWTLVCACGALWAASRALLQVGLLAPAHWCREAHVDALAQQLPLAPEEVRQFAIPALSSGVYSSCERYSDDLVAAYIQWQRDHRPPARAHEAPVTTCDQGWHYNLSALPATMTSEYNWVCADQWKPTVIKTTYWLSAAGGSVIWMIIGNRYSKCFSLVFSLGVLLFGSILTMICTAFSTVLFAWIILGCCQMAVMCLPISTVKEFSSSKTNCTLYHVAVYLTIWQLSHIASLLVFFGVSPLLTSWWWLAAVLPPLSTASLLLSVWCTWTILKKYKKELHLPLKSQLGELSDDAVLYDVHFQKVTFQTRDCSLECMSEPDCKWRNYILLAVYWLLCSWSYWMLVQTSPWLGANADAGEPSLSLTLNLFLAELPSCCYPVLKLLLPNSVVVCRHNLLTMTVLLTLAPAASAATSLVNWVLYNKALMIEVCVSAVGHFGAMSALSMARLLGLSRALHSSQSLIIWEPLGASLAAVVELIPEQRDTKMLFLLVGIIATVATLCAPSLSEYICCPIDVKQNIFPPLWRKCRSSIIDSPLSQLFLVEKTESHTKYDSSLSYTPLQPG
ncbi:solute carrier family 22 member 1-like [Schistocerca cancellata]|uniref:solute carrier family 22 member 1-like n=1 Tax=Schistocerca cancellata TaxID=274614 RepID=UPI0021197BD1|nr:solute carrier family 22 member 1-like [Schistocerca cancellata]